MSERDGLKQAYVWGAEVSVRSHGRVGPLTTIGADWASLALFDCSTRFWVDWLAKALARTRAAAQFYRYAAQH